QQKGMISLSPPTICNSAKQDTLLSLANVHAVNESGQSSVDIDRVNHQVVNVEAVNFRLPGRER
ncbi:hypothetical protein HEN53_022085, partial [Escherichia coli]|nr:hypothetical protein [Escherichia coli]